MQLKTPFLLTFFAFFLFSPLGFSQETTDEPVAPVESYTETETDQLPVSTLTIPVLLTNAELEATINRNVTGVLYEDKRFDDGDGLMFRATKCGDIKILLLGNSVKYKVPLKIWVNKELLIGSAEAEGEIALNFRTDFQLLENWKMQTITTVEYHEWLRKPALKTGFGDLSVQWIADIVLNRAKGTLSQQIDKLVAEQLAIKPAADAAWKSIQEPVLLSEEYDLWIKTTPQSIGMTPFRSEYGRIEARIGVQCTNQVTFGKKSKTSFVKPLPNLKFIQNLGDGFEINVMTEVPFEEAARLATMSLVGQTFEAGKRSVTVQGVELYGQDDKLIVKTLLTGAYNGNIYFKGVPFLNVEKNQIEMSDFDFELETHNFLHRTAGWLFQSTIRRKMEESMVFPLENNLASLKEQIQASLNHYELSRGVVLDGSLNELRVANTFLTKDAIRIQLRSTGKLLVHVVGF